MHRHSHRHMHTYMHRHMDQYPHICSVSQTFIHSNTHAVYFLLHLHTYPWTHCATILIHVHRLKKCLKLFTAFHTNSFTLGRNEAPETLNFFLVLPQFTSLTVSFSKTKAEITREYTVLPSCANKA